MHFTTHMCYYYANRFTLDSMASSLYVEKKKFLASTTNSKLQMELEKAVRLKATCYGIYGMGRRE